MLFTVEDDSTPPHDAITLAVPALRRGVFAVRNTAALTVTVGLAGQTQPIDRRLGRRPGLAVPAGVLFARLAEGGPWPRLACVRAI